MSDGDRIHREVDALELRRPRFLVSRGQAVTVVLVGYALLVTSAALLLGLVESIQGYDDHRNLDAAGIFAGLLVLPFGWALLGLGRPNRLQTLPGAAE